MEADGNVALGNVAFSEGKDTEVSVERIVSRGWRSERARIGYENLTVCSSQDVITICFFTQ